MCEPTPKELESPPVAVAGKDDQTAAISAEDLGDLKSAIESLTDKTGKTEEEEVETLKKELQGRYSTGHAFNQICAPKNEPEFILMCCDLKRAFKLADEHNKKMSFCLVPLSYFYRPLPWFRPSFQDQARGQFHNFPIKLLLHFLDNLICQLVFCQSHLVFAQTQPRHSIQSD